MARDYYRKARASVVKIQSWARGRAVVAYMRSLGTYADWLHDEYVESGNMDAVYLGVPVAWMVLIAGDVAGGRGRSGDASQEAFRKVCLWAFRGYARGDAAGVFCCVYV